jgi:hypothetical protein
MNSRVDLIFGTKATFQTREQQNGEANEHKR